MKYRVFDGHCDTPVELWMRAESYTYILSIHKNLLLPSKA